MSRPGTEPRVETWVDGLFGMFARFLGAVNRKNAEFLGNAVRLMSPYAMRNLSRRKLRGVMLAASIALALISFVAFSSYYNASRTRLQGQVVSLDLGVGLDAIAVKSYEASTTFPEGVETNPAILALGKAEPAVLDTLYTSLGATRVWGLTDGDISTGAVKLAAGRFPSAMGELAVPASWASERGARIGSSAQLAYLDTTTGTWHRVAGTVVGLVEEGSFMAGYPMTTLETFQALRGSSAANVLLLRWSSDTVPGRAINRLTGGFGLQQILTPDTPKERAARLVGGLFSPARLIIVMVFSFSALGVLNVMLLSFLQRRRQFGILKAAGAEDGELQVLLLLEGFLMALCGVAAGLVVSGLVIFLFNRYTTDRYLLDPLAVVGGVLLAVIVFYVGALLPVNMLRRATVDELLRNRHM